MGGGAAVGGAQHITLAVADIGQRAGAALAGPPAGGSEQQDRAAGDEAAADAAVGQPVQGDMQPQHRLGEQLHAVLLCTDLLASVCREIPDRPTPAPKPPSPDGPGALLPNCDLRPGLLSGGGPEFESPTLGR